MYKTNKAVPPKEMADQICAWAKLALCADGEAHIEYGSFTFDSRIVVTDSERGELHMSLDRAI